MAKYSKKTDKAPANQLSLFEQIEQINPKKFSEPDFQLQSKPLSLRIKDAISEAIKNSGKKRYVIAGEMGEQLGSEITESMLNSYTAESKEGYRMPTEFIPVFCAITKDYKVLDILVAAAGCRMVKSDEIYLLELGRVAQIEESAQKKKAEIQKEMYRLRGGLP